MAWLKIYEWERATFPWAWEQSVVPEARTRLAELLGKAFGVRLRAFLSTRGNGMARGYYVDLPKRGYDCYVGLIIHEVAHVYSNDRCYYPDRPGHGPAFKKNLIKLMVEGRRMLPEFYRHIGEENQKAREASLKHAEQVLSRAGKKLEAKEYRKTRAYKIELVTRKITRLEKRIKSTAERLKKAQRSLAALRRAEIKAGKQTEVVGNEIRNGC